MKRILIIYISTGKYSRMFRGFLSTLDKFCPGIPKNIIWYTDNDKDYLSYINYSDMELFKKYDIQVRHMDHFHWPFVALAKWSKIHESIDSSIRCSRGFTHAFYFNSNIEFLGEVDPDLFLTDKIIISHNCGWDNVGHDPLKLTYGKPIDPKSKAHIPSDYYEYCQTSMMGGPIDLFNQMAIDCDNMTAYDLAHNRIPCFHDESYGNKWIYDNPNKVTIVSNDYNMDKTHMIDWGYPNAKIVMRDSSITQYEYKDRFHEK